MKTIDQSVPVKMKPASTDRRTMSVLPRVCAALASLVAATTIANAQTISHVVTTQLNTNGDSFGVSVVDGDAKYKRSTALGEGTGAYGDGTLLDWRIHTGVNNQNPWPGTAVTAGPGTYFSVPVCSEIVGSPQNWLKVYTTADIDVAGFTGANITTGTVPQIGSSAVPLTGNINVSGLTDGKFYVVAGAFSQAVTINLTMTGPGQTPLAASTTIASPGSQNRLHSVEFSFTNPGGNYYNIAYSVNHGGTLARRRAGGVLLDGTIFVDTVEPAWVATWPNAGPVSGTLFTLNGNITENGTAYYVVLPDGATAPSSAQVKAGTDATDLPVSFSGNFALSALVPGSKMITGLTASTAYDVYVVAEDVRGPNLQAAPVLVDVTTTPPDVTAPGWTATYPQQSRTPAGLTGIGNIDESGTAYFVALPSGATAPTSAQVKAGTDAADVAAPSGSMTLLTPGSSGTKTIAGLTIGATYDVWFVAEDLEGNLQAAPTSVVSAPVAPVSQFATGGFAWGTASVWSAVTGGPYNGPWGSGNDAVFEGGSGPVAVVSGTVVNNMTFSNSFILQGGPLTLAGTTQPTITVSAGTPRIEGALAGTQGFIKAGSTTTLQMTGTNTITGGFVINGGWLGDNGGAPGTASLNNNDITANVGALGLTCAGGTTTNGGITINATTLSISNNNSSITVNGPVTGVGGITLSKTGDGTNNLNLLSTSNNFTGGVDYTSNRNITLTVNSFADSASPGTGNIRLGNSATANTQTNRFALGSGAITSLTLTNRRFELASSSSNISHEIYNESAQAFTIDTGNDLLVSGTGTKKFVLGGDGAGANAFNGVIGNGAATSLSLTKASSGTWALGGDNSYTGTTTVSAGTLLINGDQTLATGAVAVNGTSTLGGSGTIGGSVTTATAAKLAPGNAAAGTLNIANNLNIATQVAGTGKLNFQLDALANTNDKIALTGTLTIGVDKLGFNDFVFTNLGGLEVTAGTPYKLITSGGINPGDTLDPANLSGALPSGFIGELQINGNDIELVVTPNTAPTISDITDQMVPYGSNTGALDFTITDEFVNTVTPSGSSSNITLVPNANIVFGGSGADRTVTVTPAPGQTGTATITVTVTDNGGLTATDTFVLTVTASYASWINSFFPGETDPLIIGASADPDNDCIENGVEIVIGGNPATGMNAALLPTLELVNADPDGDLTFADYLLFTYRRSDLSVAAGVTADCETDIDLVAPWTAATGAPGVVIQVDDNYGFFVPAATDTDRVRVYVPRGANTTLFGRLNVLVP